MMSEIENPPAFEASVGLDGSIYEGISLRDWFAGQALAQASRDIWEHHKPEDVAKRCYIFADAMLAARKAKP